MIESLGFKVSGNDLEIDMRVNPFGISTESILTGKKDTFSIKTFCSTESPTSSVPKTVRGVTYIFGVAEVP